MGAYAVQGLRLEFVSSGESGKELFALLSGLAA